MVLEILGLIATIVFGILSIDLFKRKRRPCKLTYFPSEAINLYRNLAMGFDNLEILKDKQPIKNNIVYLSGVFASNGDMDITGDNHVVSMHLPEGCKWMGVKVGNSTKGINAKFYVNEDDPRNATLSFDLFRVKEYINLQALVEYEDVKAMSSLYNLHRDITFSHRIENTGDVENGEIIKRYIPLKRKYFFLAIILLMITVFFSMIMFLDNSDNVIYKEIKTNKEYSCMVSDDNMIELHSRSLLESFVEWKPEKISVSEFKKNYIPVYRYKGMSLQLKTMMFAFGFFYIIGLIMSILLILKARRINKLYLLYKDSEKEEKESDSRTTPSAIGSQIGR